MSIKASQGKHLIAEFYECQCEITMLSNLNTSIELFKQAVEETGLTLVGEASHQFLKLSNEINHDTGYTLSILLAESHLNIHTWGEHKTVTLDVYVCNYKNDNSDKADLLLQKCRDIFLPKHHNVKTINREHIFNKK